METAAKGARALTVVSPVLLTLGGCSYQVTTQTVKSPVLERRTPVDASEPLVRSEWQVAGGQVLGHVAWSSCVSQRAWTVEDQRVEHVRPIPAAGWLTVAAGLGLATVGLAIRKTTPSVAHCTLYIGDGSTYQPADFSTCRPEEPDNTTSDINIVAGAAAIVTGALLLGIRPSDKVTVLQREPHAATSVSPCVGAEDLSVMVLVLKLGPNRFVHVTLQPDGEASADLSPSAQLPKGADLPILVYRAPPTLAKTLPRWSVVGQVHVPD